MNTRDNIIGKIEEAMGLTFPEEQLDIITHKGKPSNVISCAGSGKTTLMIASICYMQMKHKISPKQIIVISFNKSAVDEIAERYGEVANKLKLGVGVTFKTFHAMYYMILRYYINKMEDKELKVMSDAESAALFSRAFYDKSQNKSEETRDSMLSLRGYAVNNLITNSQQMINSPKFITSEVDPKDYFDVIKEYRELKGETDLIDFDDLQIKMLELMREIPEARERVQSAWDYWYIDEYQDISKVQMEILKLSIKDINNLVTIGDEDQAIYEFRGSKVDYIVDFPIYFEDAKRYIMGINYRCPDVILRRAEAMITQNNKRVDKKMKSYNDGGLLTYSGHNTCSEASIRIAELIEKDFFESDIRLHQIAVLYRNSRQQLFIVDQLVQRGIPVKVMRSSNLLHSHQIIKDIRNIVEFALDEYNTHMFSQVFTKVTRYVRKTYVNEITNEMMVTGKSWRELVTDNNESIQEASKVLHNIKLLVESKSTTDLIVEEVMKIYSNFLSYAQRNMASTEDEINDIINYAKYIGKDKTFKQFVYYIERAKSLIDMYSKDKDAVTITTMHTVKGLQYDNVYILDASDDVLPNYKREMNIREQFGDEAADDYIEQERRLFYVACTRAKKELYITYNLGVPSRFIREQIAKENLELPVECGEELIIDTGVQAEERG